MRIIIFILFIISHVSMAQKAAFFDALKKNPYHHYQEGGVPMNRELNIINFNASQVISDFYYMVNQHEYRRSRTPLKQDSIYNKICETSLQIFNKSIFRSKQIWNRKKKYFYKALIQLNSNYRFYHAFVFKVKLVDYTWQKYYYDRNDTDSDLHLIYGNKKDNKVKLDEGFELEYIKPISEALLMTNILRKLVQYFGKKNFGSNYYSKIGFSIKLNEKSVNRRAIPEVYVMVMIGGKVMQKLRI